MPGIPVSFPDLDWSGKKESGTAMPSILSLRIFGLAYYKFNNAFWNPDGLCKENPDLLLQEARQWLQNNKVNHQDFTFFTRTGYYQR